MRFIHSLTILPGRLQKATCYSVATALSVFMMVPALIGQVRLPQLVRDSMVLQRDAPINIWGWAKAGEKVTVRFNGKKFTAVTGKDQGWKIKMPAIRAGGPYTMAIDASNHIVLKDILVGDVWICSGQSNMVHQMNLHKETYAKDISETNNPMIRHFWIPTTTNLNGPQDDLKTGSWKAADPENVLQFSAVAYYFAKSIFATYKVPIGLINASVGGTPVQAWTSEEGLKQFPEIAAVVTKNKDTGYIGNINRQMADRNAARKPVPDLGLTSDTPWFRPDYNAAGWRPVTVPGYWEDQGVKDLDGIVWYRKEFDLPAAFIDNDAKITLGRIVDADVVYLNGELLGNTGYQYPQRRYMVAKGKLKAGRNILVVKVTNNAGKGGFVPDKPYHISTVSDTMLISGTWHYKVGAAFPPPDRSERGVNFSAQNSPAALYNAMISPLINYSVKGFLWYQGESNSGEPKLYAELMPAIIADWRNKWKNPELPFLFVQLPNFMDVAYLPSESRWAETREAQLHTLKVPNTAMAVAIDLGEWNDIHPDNKKDVGERLAMAARHLAYNDTNVVYSGPLYTSSRTEGDKIILSFTNTGSGLATSDGRTPSSFAIASDDKKFVWAKTRIEGDKIVVWHESVAKPKFVRYAWADNPDNPNLVNKEGLPASPFRTDL